MNEKEVKKALQVINEMWPGDMTGLQARMYGEALVELESGPVEILLKGFLHSGRFEFRPGIGDIVSQFKEPEPPVLSRLRRVLAVIKIYPPGNRRQHIDDPTSLRAVDLLGGFIPIGSWEMEGTDRQWYEKRFVSAYEEARDYENNCETHAAVTGEPSPIVASLAGAKSTPAPTPKPSPRKVTDSGLTAEFRKMLKGGE